MDDHAAPTTQALDLIKDRFPHALGAILGGSAAHGRATPTSDLDVAVLLPDGDTSRREVVRHGGRLARTREQARAVLAGGPVRGKDLLLDGHRAVAEHVDPTPVAVATEQVLDVLGGPLKEGYTQRWRA
ncbi:nucleotidyltransferase domain-containing protein [Streptomyces sp. N2A]|uniref:nucleotidyltransferase domain-containing protein n=1 Tax=Streptomyces sp. N2A TaxID=3073936 RepID=UPI00286FC548|nr:nucleotidyltransferase domain-containing protein [Streptomyces sp. N2A]